LELYEFDNVIGEHFFVARDDRAAGDEGSFDDVKRSFGVVNEFNDEVDVRVVKYVVGIVGKVGLNRTRFFNVADANARDRDVWRINALKELV
jgi:hypothetical protein